MTTFDDGDHAPMTPKACDVYWADECLVSGTVVTGIARTLGVDPFDLPPLHDAIDPDALDALFDADAAVRRPTGTTSGSRATAVGCS